MESPTISLEKKNKQARKSTPKKPKLNAKTPQDSAFKTFHAQEDDTSSPLKTPIKTFSENADANQQRTTPKQKGPQKPSIKQPVQNRPKSVAKNLASDLNFVKEQLQPEKLLATESGSIKAISDPKFSKTSQEPSIPKQQGADHVHSSSNPALMTFGRPAVETKFKKRFVSRKRVASNDSKSSNSDNGEVQEPDHSLEHPKPSPGISPRASQRAHRGSGSSGSTGSRQETNEMSPFTPQIDVQRLQILDLDQQSRRRGISLHPVADKKTNRFQRQIQWLQIVIEANGVFAKTWASINTLLLISVGIFAPIRAGIMKDERADYIYIIEKFTDLFFLLDIIVNLITPVIVDGDKVSEFCKIVKHYFKGWFWIDFVSFLPLGDILGAFDLPERYSVYARLIRGLKLTKLFKIFKAHDTQEIGADNYVIAFVWNLIENELQFTMVVWSVWMILVVHVFACFWYWMGRFNDGTSWGYVNNFSNESVLDFYISSCYFIMQTFSSTGYGDIISKNTEEIGFRIGIIIIGGILYTLFTGKLAMGISDLVSIRDTVDNQLRALKRICDDFQLPDSTYHRLKYSIRLKLDKNYHYTARHNELKDVFTMKHASDCEADRECYNHCTLELGKLKNMPFFKPLPTNASLDALKNYSACMRKLFAVMKVRKYEAGQFIYCKGDSARTFYIIESGSVGFCQSVYGEEFVFSKIGLNKSEASTPAPISDFARIDRTNSLQTTSNNLHDMSKRNIVEGGYFGEIEVVTEGVDKRQFTAKALNDCIIHCVDAGDYMKILYDHKVDPQLAKSIEMKTLQRMEVIQRNLDDFKQEIHSNLKKLLEKKFSSHIVESQANIQEDSHLENQEQPGQVSSGIIPNLKDAAVAEIWSTLDEMLFNDLSPFAHHQPTRVRAASVFRPNSGATPQQSVIRSLSTYAPKSPLTAAAQTPSPTSQQNHLRDPEQNEIPALPRGFELSPFSRTALHSLDHRASVQPARQPPVQPTLTRLKSANVPTLNTPSPIPEHQPQPNGQLPVTLPNNELLVTNTLIPTVSSFVRRLPFVQQKLQRLTAGRDSVI